MVLETYITESKKRKNNRTKCTDEQKMFVETIEMLKAKYDITWREVGKIFGVSYSTIMGWKSIKSGHFIPVGEKNMQIYIDKAVAWLQKKGDSEMADLFYLLDKDSNVQDVKIKTSPIEQTISLLVDRQTKITTEISFHREKLEKLEAEQKKLHISIETLREYRKLNLQ